MQGIFETVRKNATIKDPVQGMAVIVAKIVERALPMAGGSHLNNRCDGSKGELLNAISGNGGVAFFVQHEDETIGAYWLDELNEIM